MENKMPPSPTGAYDLNFHGDLLRKRKSSPMKQADTSPDTYPEYSVTRDSKLQKTSSLSGIDSWGIADGLGLNQRKSTEPPTSRHQLPRDQFSYQNSSADTGQTGNRNFHGTGIENMSNVPLGFLPQSSTYTSPFPFINTPIGEPFTFFNQQPQACNLFGQTDNSVPLTELSKADSEKTEVDPFWPSLEIKNRDDSDQLHNQICSTPSKSLRSMEILQQSSVVPNSSSDDSGGRTCPHDANKFKFSSDHERGAQFSNNAGSSDVQTVGTSSLGARCHAEQSDNSGILETEVHYSSSCLGDTCENKERSLVGDNTRRYEQTISSDSENTKYHLMEEGLLKNGDSFSKLDEKSNLRSGKPVSTVAEILWVGSIQLNSSVTISAVAFFKSGEKLLDINWSDFIEVKGKVRLEAFEKYIQDLPRSRNRGLMVISLRWKEGSSESGLKGMKEVAKGYKRGDRVGFAKPSPGIDLYICPRCDKIITILAKYGFFKGMAAAVEDNQDSLIGCVVWRKNQSSLNSSSRKSESKNAEEPLKSPDPSVQVTDGKMSPKQFAQESVPVASVTAFSTTESAMHNDPESKNVDSSEIRPEVDNSLSCDKSLSTPLVTSNNRSTSVGETNFVHSNSASQQYFHGQLLEVESPTIPCSGPEQRKANLGLEKLVMPLPSEKLKPVPTFDDDDLPEFDFGSSCGIYQIKMNKAVGAVTFDKSLPAERIKQFNGSAPPTVPIVQGKSVLNQCSVRSVLLQVPFASSQGLPPPMRICEHDVRKSVVPRLEEKPRVQSNANTTIPRSASSAPLKNLFDDDDDMPEWCPPVLYEHSSGETIRASAPFTSKCPNSTFQGIQPFSTGPVSSSPSPDSTQPIFSSQELPPFHFPEIANVKAPQPRPFLRAPAADFNSNSSMRPRNSSIDVKHPFPAVDKRGWRP